MSMRMGIAAICCGCWCCTANWCQATLITEYFNNYGAARQPLSTIDSPAATGWAGDWIGDRAVDYMPGENLTSAKPGYLNDGNEGSADDGLARHGGGFAGNIVKREIDVDPLSPGNQGLTGTIWLSALVRQVANGTDALLHLDFPDGPGNYLALAGSTGTLAPFDGVPEPIMQYAKDTITTSEANFPVNTTYLFVAKIVIDSAPGGLDSLDFWVDPPMANVAGLGAPVYSKATADAFGDSFSGVGISFGVPFPFVEGSRLDAIRISNDADAFDDIRGKAGAAAQPGDTDDDGDVDIEDLNNVRNQFGGAGEAIVGDTDGNHVVDIVDLNNVRNYFGASEFAAVPEPAGWTLALAAISYAWLLRRLSA